MFLVVGLGNPGDKYTHTRHNIGFMVADQLAHDNQTQFSDSKWQADTAKVMLWSQKAIIVKPQTYMNNSGVAVGKIASYYKVSPDKIIVVHDELDIDLFNVKLVTNRGAGGHKGITSIINHLSNKEFIRIRVGIGRPPTEAMPVSNFVLSKFSTDQQSDLTECIDKAVKCIQQVIELGLNKAMNSVNCK